jgi:hypothetical protein
LTLHSTDRVQFTVTGDRPFEVTMTAPFTSVT